MIRHRLATVALIAWLIGGALLGGVLLIKHLVALPVPASNDDALRLAVRTDLPAHDWRLIHVMYRSCGCSQRTVAHLMSEPRPAGVVEEVLLVDDRGAGDPEDRRLVAAGFHVRVIDPSTLHSRYHLDAAPVLIVVRPDDSIAYIGGYNRHKQSAVYEDGQILADARASHSTKALPVYGCATSERLADRLDPLSLSKR